MFTRKVLNYFLININLYLNDFKQIYIQVHRLNSFKMIKILIDKRRLMTLNWKNSPKF